MFPTLCNTHNTKELTTSIYCEHRLGGKPQTFLRGQSVFSEVGMNPKKPIASIFSKFVSERSEETEKILSLC